MAGDGRVYQREGLWWMDWTDASGKRHRRSLGLEEGAKEAKAKRTLQAYKAEVEAERAVRGSGLLERLGIEAAPSSGAAPLSGLAARWLENLRLRGLKPLTLYRHEATVRAWIFPFFGHEDARKLTAERIDSFQRHVAASTGRHGKPLKPQSVNEILQTLKLIVDHGVELGLVRHVDFPSRLRPQIQESPWWSTQERDQLLDAALRHAPAWWSFFALAFGSGLRLGELLALRWQDVFLVPEQERVRVTQTRHFKGIGPPKSGKERWVWLGNLAVEALQKQRTARPVVRLDGDEPVFPGERAPYMSVSPVRETLQMLCQKAGLEYRRFHSTRHSFCSHLVERGATPVDVQRLAGHASLSTTQRYFHAADEQLRQAALLLNDHPRGTFAVQAKDGSG